MAARKVFDYSKWDKIELSDDESDVHPNIDKDSWFRWKHRARIEREEKEAKEKEAIEEKLKLARAERTEILGKLGSLQASIEGEELKAEEEGLGAELTEVETAIHSCESRLDEMLKNQKWNVDNIGTVVKDYTFINRRESTPDVLSEEVPKSSEDVAAVQKGAAAPAHSPAVAPPTLASPAKAVPLRSKPSGPESETAAAENYNTFAKKYERLLEDFSELESLEKTKDLLHEQGYILLAEHAQSYLLLSCLEDEMNGKHARMRNTARQSQLLSHITELAVTMRRNPRDVVIPLFKRLQEPEHLRGFQQAVADFIVKIEKRAVEKRKEMDAAEPEYEEVEVPRAERLGPGGLDPVEVFEKLPTVLQEAFESRDMQKLQDALASLPLEEARRHMKDCADSGLWLPNENKESADEGK